MSLSKTFYDSRQHLQPQQFATTHKLLSHTFHEDKNSFPVRKISRNSVINTKKLYQRFSQFDQITNYQQTIDQYQVLKDRYQQVIKKYKFKIKTQTHLPNENRKRPILSQQHNISELLIKKQPLRVLTQSMSKERDRNRLNKRRISENILLSKSLSLKKKKGESPDAKSSNLIFTQIQDEVAEQPVQNIQQSSRMRIRVGLKNSKNMTQIPKKSKNSNKKMKRKRKSHKKYDQIIPQSDEEKIKGWETKNFHKEDEHDHLAISH